MDLTSARGSPIGGYRRAAGSAAWKIINGNVEGFVDRSDAVRSRIREFFVIVVATLSAPGFGREKFDRSHNGTDGLA